MMVGRGQRRSAAGGAGNNYCTKKAEIWKSERQMQDVKTIANSEIAVGGRKASMTPAKKRHQYPQCPHLCNAISGETCGRIATKSSVQ
jgi:hypothetical protein